MNSTTLITVFLVPALAHAHTWTSRPTAGAAISTVPSHLEVRGQVYEHSVSEMARLCTEAPNLCASQRTQDLLAGMKTAEKASWVAFGLGGATGLGLIVAGVVKRSESKGLERMESAMQGTTLVIGGGAVALAGAALGALIAPGRSDYIAFSNSINAGSSGSPAHYQLGLKFGLQEVTASLRW